MAVRKLRVGAKIAVLGIGALELCELFWGKGKTLFRVRNEIWLPEIRIS